MTKRKTTNYFFSSGHGFQKEKFSNPRLQNEMNRALGHICAHIG